MGSMKQPFAAGALKSIRFAGMFVSTSHKLSVIPEQMYYSLSLLLSSTVLVLYIKIYQNCRKNQGNSKVPGWEGACKTRKIWNSQGPNDLHLERN
jgi:hypothetical protein